MADDTESSGVTEGDVFATGMKQLLGALEQSKAAIIEAFKDPNTPPVMSDTAKKYPPGLAQYVNNVVVAAGLWEDRLKKRFGVEMRYEIDLDGFTGQPERNELALINLKEMGVDWMYYALTTLADKLPGEFATMVRNRVRVLKIVRVATAAEKSLTADGHSLVLRAELHKDYTGYLTMQEMMALLPALVEGMPEVPREELHAFWSGPAEPAEEDGPDPKIELLESAKRDAAGALANCGPQLAGVFGRAVKMDMDWAAMVDAEGVWSALNASLSPVLAGLMVAAQDAGVKKELAKRVRGIVLKAVDETGKGFALVGKTLVYQAAGTIPMDAMRAAELLKQLLGSGKSTTSRKKPRAAKPLKKPPAKPKAKRKPSAKPTPKATSKKKPIARPTARTTAKKTAKRTPQAARRRNRK